MNLLLTTTSYKTTTLVRTLHTGVKLLQYLKKQQKDREVWELYLKISYSEWLNN